MLEPLSENTNQNLEVAPGSEMSGVESALQQDALSFDHASDRPTFCDLLREMRCLGTTSALAHAVGLPPPNLFSPDLFATYTGPGAFNHDRDDEFFRQTVSGTVRSYGRISVPVQHGDGDKDDIDDVDEADNGVHEDGDAINNLDNLDGYAAEEDYGYNCLEALRDS